MSAATEPIRLNFRPPPSLSSSSPFSSASTTSLSPSFTRPSTNFLTGTWHVTHSTLPMWKSNRNVRITYTPLKSASQSPSTSVSTSGTGELSPSTIDDLVEYQSLGSDKWKTINGIDKLDTSDYHAATFEWRGKGWLKIASSRWSVVGWGDEEGGWAVTFFEKTLFTPAGVDIYARQKGGLSRDLVGRIKEEMKRVGVEMDGGEGGGNGDFAKHAEALFDIRHDWD